MSVENSLIMKFVVYVNVMWLKILSHFQKKLS